MILPAVGALGAAPASTSVGTALAGAGNVLVFTGTGGTPNPAAADAASALQALGAANGFGVDTSSSAADISAANLAGYRAVVFVNSAGDVLDAAQEADLQAYVEGGGGFVGIGETANLEPGATFFNTLIGLVGASRTSGSTGASAQDVEFLDRVNPASRTLPMLANHADEWYSWTTNPTGSVHTVARARMGAPLPTGETFTNDTVRNSTTTQPQQERAVSWCRDLQQGRSFFTAMGRTTDAYADPSFLNHLLGAIQWASGMTRGNCKATITSNYTATRLTPPNPAGTTTYVGESDGIAFADDGRIFYIGRAVCFSGAVQVTNWDSPNTGLGCGTLHVWDPSVAGPDDQNAAKVTKIAELAVFGAKGGGAESGTTSKAEQGILGIALDPKFTAGRPYIYLQWYPYFADANGPGFSRPTFMGERRLSRFTYDEATKTLVPGSEKVIMHWLAQVYSCCHVGGSMDWDSQGNLLIATGDNTGNTPNSNNGGYTNSHPNYTVPVDGVVRTNHNTTPGGGVISFADARQTSGNTNSFEGKLLRIHPLDDPGPTPGLAASAPGQVDPLGGWGIGTTYTIPGADAPNGPNLFDGTEGGGGKTKREIFAMGVRNLYSVNVDPVTDLITTAWVGPDQGTNSSTWGPAKTENATIMSHAGNYGWPFCMGNHLDYRAKLPNNSGGGLPAPFGHPGTVGGGADGLTGGWWDCRAGQPLTNESPYNTGLTTIPPMTATNIWYGPQGGCYDFPRNDNGVPLYTDSNSSLSPASFRRCPWMNGGGQAPITAPIYRHLSSNPNAWPDYWDGRWFLLDFTGSGNVRHAMSFDPAIMAAGNGGQPVSVDALSSILTNATAGGNNQPIDWGFGPDGALYVQRYSGSNFTINNANNSLWRFAYTGGPSTPIPQATAAPSPVERPQQVSFTGSRSGGVSWAWDFGDGGTSTEANPAHAYTSAGDFTAELTVTYADGEKSVVETQVSVVDRNVRSELSALRAELATHVGSAGSKKAEVALGKALVNLDEGLQDGNWVAGAKLSPQSGRNVFDVTAKAVGELQKVEGAWVAGAIQTIADLDRTCALYAIYDAPAGLAKTNAVKELGRGDTALARGNVEGAIELYRKAWALLTEA